MSMSPINATGLAKSREALGRTHTKRVATVAQLPPAMEARRLAGMLRQAAQFEAALATAAADGAPVHLLTTQATLCRDRADRLCIEADLYTHLLAAELLNGGDAA
jgi:hypothetical protein